LVRISDGHHCKFWQWYLGSGTVRYGEFPEFQSIVPLHEQVHLQVEKILAMTSNGRGQAALECLPGLHETRDAVLKLLEALIERVTRSPIQPLQVV